MDVIFLTGAGSEPAQSIARRLVSQGFRVYGFASQFPGQGFQHADFIPVAVNLADPEAVRAEAAAILAQETTVTGVVLAGHYPVEDTFEAVHAEDIPLALNAGVVGPLLLVRAVLPMLVRRRGHIIALTRSAPDGTGAALAAATAGALREFVRALFAELRDTGVKATHLRLEGNPGPADPAARFTHAPQSQVQPDIVADTIETLLRLRENNALTELVLRPQATREEPRLPVSTEPRLRAIQVVQLPPRKNFPPPEETIYTPERKRPDYAPPPGQDDDTGDEDDEDNGVDPELLYLIRPNHQRQVAQASGKNAGGEKREERSPKPQRAPKPRAGALRIHPPAASEQHTHTPQKTTPPLQSSSPFPPNWHGPRPPTPRQLERLAHRRQHQRPRPATPPPVPSGAPAAPVPEFVPPPPRETTSDDIPIFVPPVSLPSETTPGAAGLPSQANPVENEALPQDGATTKPAKKTARSAPAKKPSAPKAGAGAKTTPARRKKTAPEA